LRLSCIIHRVNHNRRPDLIAIITERLVKRCASFVSVSSRKLRGNRWMFACLFAQTFREKDLTGMEDISHKNRFILSEQLTCWTNGISNACKWRRKENGEGEGWRCRDLEYVPWRLSPSLNAAQTRIVI